MNYTVRCDAEGNTMKCEMHFCEIRNKSPVFVKFTVQFRTVEHNKVEMMHCDLVVKIYSTVCGTVW